MNTKQKMRPSARAGISCRIRMVCAAAIWLAVAFQPVVSRAAPAGKAEHVVIVVWDGMRPDFITEQHTPALFRLAQQGTFFKNHHPVFLSTTEVNGTAINTGMYPEHSGILANVEYRPDIDPLKPVATEDMATVRRGDELTGSHYIGVPTLAEIVQQAGFRTAVAGSKTVALLFDRSQARASESARASIDLFRGQTVPASAVRQLEAANGDKRFPALITYPNAAQDAWTTTALTRGMWAKDVPKFSVLWMSDPDYTQHDSGPGSPAALGALESVDRDLALLLKTLDERKLRDKTDIFVVSDHGFSTVQRHVDVTGVLRQAGFKASKTFKAPQPGDIMVDSLGGSVALYVVGHDQAAIRRLAEFFQASDYAGVLFSKIPVEGTFPLSQVHTATDNAPDLLVSMRWNAGTNRFGAPGMLVADTTKIGMHGSLSPFDMHNTLVAAGPDFREGFSDELPSGNVDLAPTILWILGIPAPEPMDGRILAEAMMGAAAAPHWEQKTIETAGTHWRQYIKISFVGSTDYYDEGNCKTVP